MKLTDGIKKQNLVAKLIIQRTKEIDMLLERYRDFLFQSQVAGADREIKHYQKLVDRLEEEKRILQLPGLLPT